MVGLAEDEQEALRQEFLETTPGSRRIYCRVDGEEDE
jgi:hypothetical protein